MTGQTTLADHASQEGGTAPLVREYLQAMSVLGLDEDDRCQMLRHCHSFYAGTQHDHHGSDWNGVPRDPGVGYMHERLRPQGFVPVNSVPHGQRRPDAPVPLARQVVSRFTEMLLGEGRHPGLQVATDEATQDYLEEAFREGKLWDVLAQARDTAGSSRSAAVVLGLRGGYIDAEVLHPADLWVAEWCDETPGWRPKVVVEQKRVTRTVLEKDESTSGGRPKYHLVSRDYWQTRAWTPEEVVYYEDVRVDRVDDDDAFKVKKPTRPHKFGRCPVIWYQNTRNTDAPDGAADCEGVWQLLDKLDRLQSQVYKAAIGNTDPTIVIKETRHGRRRNSIIQKGSNHVIPVSPEGDVKYLEVQGTSVRVGLEGVSELSSEVLQTVECVVISPEYAKAYQSGEALQILWRSMESRANRLRTTLGSLVQEMCRLLLKMAEAYGVANIEEVGTDKDRSGILLPPRRVVKEVEPEEVELEPEPGAPPKPKPEPEVEWVAHKPGKPNAYVSLEWPPYWTPTASQIAQMATAMASATGQKQVLSSETATRTMSQMLGHDADTEIRRVEEEKEAGFNQLVTGMMGGEDDDDDDDDEEDDDEAPFGGKTKGAGEDDDDSD